MQTSDKAPQPNDLTVSPTINSSKRNDDTTMQRVALTRFDTNAKPQFEHARDVLHPTPFRSRRTNRSSANQPDAFPNDR